MGEFLRNKVKEQEERKREKKDGAKGPKQERKQKKRKTEVKLGVEIGESCVSF